MVQRSRNKSILISIGKYRVAGYKKNKLSFKIESHQMEITLVKKGINSLVFDPSNMLYSMLT